MGELENRFPNSTKFFSKNSFPKGTKTRSNVLRIQLTSTRVATSRDGGDAGAEEGNEGDEGASGLHFVG